LEAGRRPRHEIKMGLSTTRHQTYLVLNKVESVHHEADSGSPMYPNGQHTDDTTLQAVVEAERGPRSTFHVEGNALETAHMEESLVLDACETRMVQEVTEHEASWLGVDAYFLLASIRF